MRPNPPKNQRGSADGSDDAAIAVLLEESLLERFVGVEVMRAGQSAWQDEGSGSGQRSFLEQIVRADGYAMCAHDRLIARDRDCSSLNAGAAEYVGRPDSFHFFEASS